MLNGTWLYYKTILCPLLIYNVQPRHCLYCLNEQMTANSALTKRNIQKPTLILGAMEENLLFFFCHMELLSLINCNSRNSSSDSSSNLSEFK